MESTRRNLLILAGIAPLAAITGARASTAAACYDPAKLALSQKNRRRAIGFVEVSADPAKRCGGCAFFKKTAGDCGTCDMLGGGPVTVRGVCTSFAAKAR